MATISKTADWFRIKNPKLAKGDYAIVVDSTGVPTGVTKQGTGKYYNDTPEATVTVDNSTGKNIGVSAGALTNGGAYFRSIPVLGTVDGVNVTFAVSHVPLQVIADTQVLIAGIGYTIAGLTITTLYPPVNGIVAYGNY